MIYFTRQEKQVILFFAAICLAGAGIELAVKSNSFLKQVPLFGQEIGKVDLNTADKAILLKVPGIGDKLASRILDYRKEAGGFRDIQELRKIKGVTASRYERIVSSVVAK